MFGGTLGLKETIILNWIEYNFISSKDMNNIEAQDNHQVNGKNEIRRKTRQFTSFFNRSQI